MIELFYLAVRVFFFLFALGVAFHLYHLVMDSRQDLDAVKYVKEFHPELYKTEYEMVANDTIRNMWYRFIVALLMLSIAVFILLVPIPRPLWVTTVLNLFLVSIPLVMLVNARDEVTSRQALKEWFRGRRREAKKNEY